METRRDLGRPSWGIVFQTWVDIARLTLRKFGGIWEIYLDSSIREIRIHVEDYAEKWRPNGGPLAADEPPPTIGFGH